MKQTTDDRSQELTDDVHPLLREIVRSTSKRTFFLYPTLVLTEQAIARRKLRPIGLLFMAWGYAQYLFVGKYRLRHGGGGPGVSGPPPEHLVTTGLYRFTRNPMYSAHIIYLTGLTIFTGSPGAIAILLGVIPWFQRRVLRDEVHMTEIFGDEYEMYCKQVGRWGPRITSAK